MSDNIALLAAATGLATLDNTFHNGTPEDRARIGEEIAADIRAKVEAGDAKASTFARLHRGQLLAAWQAADIAAGGLQYDATTRPLYFPPKIEKRNLLYHVCPLAGNDGWRKNVGQLMRRMDVFNGRRVIAIATGAGLEHPRAVRDAMAGQRCQFLELPNDRELREVATFLPLLLSVASTEPTEASFYAHTKGNSTDGSRIGSIYWRNMMYRELLDGWQHCMAALSTYAAVGCHKMVWPNGAKPPYPTGLIHGRWMFAGTFFHFRHDRIFGHPAWRNIPMDRYGAESWLSGMFEPHACRSIYQLWPEDMYPTPNPYNPLIYPDPIGDEDAGDVLAFQIRREGNHNISITRLHQ